MCSLSEVGGPCQLGSKPCWRCCWSCCCSCSWAKCLAVKSGSENGPTKKPRDPSPCDPLLCDGEPPTTLEEIQSWGKSFDKLMRSAAGRKLFRDFLRCEYSEENIMFWLACEELKRETNPDAVEEKARFIYEDYISILSPKEVSLDSRVREIVNRNMVEPTPHTFDEAQLQIYTLMHRDSYPRFVNSPLYKTLAQITTSASASAAPDRPSPGSGAPESLLEHPQPSAESPRLPTAPSTATASAVMASVPTAVTATAPTTVTVTPPTTGTVTAPATVKVTATATITVTAPTTVTVTATAVQ